MAKVGEDGLLYKIKHLFLTLIDAVLYVIQSVLLITLSIIEANMSLVAITGHSRCHNNTNQLNENSINNGHDN